MFGCSKQQENKSYIFDCDILEDPSIFLIAFSQFYLFSWLARCYCRSYCALYYFAKSDIAHCGMSLILSFQFP